jgi:hypothetical protein
VRGFTRRRFLAILGTAAAWAGVTLARRPGPPKGPPRASDALAPPPATPEPRSSAQAPPTPPASERPRPRRPAPAAVRTLSGAASFGALRIAAGETLRFDPRRSTTVTVTGNVVVEGTLEMRPAPGVTHVLRFADVDESRFVGGGMDPIPSDVGLWVMGRGRLLIEGTPRRAWSRTPVAWPAADECVTAPTAPGVHAFRPGRLWDDRAEVLNLTRNVRIEGTPEGRAHLFIRSAAPQAIRFATLRYLGPRPTEAVVLGRYPLHFHHCGAGSRGSVVEGVVVRDSGQHAFVPHASHGIAFRDCIAYEVAEDPYWWDPGEPTDDVLFEGCVAALVRAIPSFRGFRLGGFRLGVGERNAVRGSVAVCVLGGSDSAGFVWDGPSGVWEFDDNVAHNNPENGMFVWFNQATVHPITGFRAYANGRADVVQHAYANNFRYEGGELASAVAVELHAVDKGSAPDQRTSFTRTTMRRRFEILGHVIAAEKPAVLTECALEGGVRVDEGDGERGLHDFVRCTRAGRGLERADFDVRSMARGSVIRVFRRDGASFSLTG